MQRINLPFRLRGREGHVKVEYAVNDDPYRWGYALLGLSYPPDAARGFPVCRASVVYPAEGYHATMGWIQIIRYHTEDSADETVLVDTAPQLSDTRMPYCAWGVNPSFFDAPSTPRRGIIWVADTFLVSSPDALITRAVEPVCGFRWGYTTGGEQPEVLPITQTGSVAWSSVRAVLHAQYPSWEFCLEWANER
jgi:hypothetical protein